ncbi:hypothetical protein [Streptococcus jiangjianxini]|uniref:hypothetical protein n=1 Tax=Streptococcus jiangjianxini TaxID=3161189 RepID=UPI0032EFCDFB
MTVEFYEKFDVKNLNAPPEMVPGQEYFQMGITIDQIEKLGVTPYDDIYNLNNN